MKTTFFYGAPFTDKVPHNPKSCHVVARSPEDLKNNQRSIKIPNTLPKFRFGQVWAVPARDEGFLWIPKNIKLIFQQVDIPTYRAKIVQAWFKSNLTDFIAGDD